MKILDVCGPMLNHRGEPYLENKVDSRGRVQLTDQTYKYPHQVAKTDEPVLEERRVGDIMIYALCLEDRELTQVERAKRFTLTCRIQQALDENRPLELAPKREDENRIQEACKLVTNHMFVARVEQALEAVKTVESGDETTK